MFSVGVLCMMRSLSSNQSEASLACSTADGGSAKWRYESGTALSRRLCFLGFYVGWEGCGWFLARKREESLAQDRLDASIFGQGGYRWKSELSLQLKQGSLAPPPAREHEDVCSSRVLNPPESECDRAVWVLRARLPTKTRRDWVYFAGSVVRCACSSQKMANSEQSEGATALFEYSILTSTQCPTEGTLRHRRSREELAREIEHVGIDIDPVCQDWAPSAFNACELQKVRSGSLDAKTAVHQKFGGCPNKRPLKREAERGQKMGQQEPLNQEPGCVLVVKAGCPTGPGQTDKKKVVDFQEVQGRKSPRGARTGREEMKVEENARFADVVGVDAVPWERSDTHEEEERDGAGGVFVRTCGERV
eukprot:2090131-Pleurochrysis_carterae.AAC.1